MLLLAPYRDKSTQQRPGGTRIFRPFILVEKESAFLFQLSILFSSRLRWVPPSSGRRANYAQSRDPPPLPRSQVFCSNRAHLEVSHIWIDWKTAEMSSGCASRTGKLMVRRHSCRLNWNGNYPSSSNGSSWTSQTIPWNQFKFERPES